jgi:hypothetical protein
MEIGCIMTASPETTVPDGSEVVLTDDHHPNLDESPKSLAAQIVDLVWAEAGRSQEFNGVLKSACAIIAEAVLAEAGRSQGFNKALAQVLNTNKKKSPRKKPCPAPDIDLMKTLIGEDRQKFKIEEGKQRLKAKLAEFPVENLILIATKKASVPQKLVKGKKNKEDVIDLIIDKTLDESERLNPSGDKTNGTLFSYLTK